MDDSGTRDKTAVDAALIRELDDLVRDANFHGVRIQESVTRLRETRPPYPDNGERFDGIDRRLDGVDQRFDRVDQRLDGLDHRLGRVEHRLDGVDHRLDALDRRLDGIERVLIEIRGQMATRVELEAVTDHIKVIADGYQTVNARLDRVADLLKTRVLMP